MTKLGMPKIDRRLISKKKLIIDGLKNIIKAELVYNGPIEAPIEKNDKLEVFNVYVSGELKKYFSPFC